VTIWRQKGFLRGKTALEAAWAAFSIAPNFRFSIAPQRELGTFLESPAADRPVY
jgi:hypothetical protein